MGSRAIQQIWSSEFFENFLSPFVLHWGGWAEEVLISVWGNEVIPKQIRTYSFCSKPLNQFSSVTQSSLTLCDPVNCSAPGFPVLHHLTELAQTHVHQVSDAIQISSSVGPLSFHLQSFPESWSFPVSQFFSSSGQSTGV